LIKKCFCQNANAATKGNNGNSNNTLKTKNPVNTDAKYLFNLTLPKLKKQKESTGCIFLFFKLRRSALVRQ
jgi:hypothetical protein